MECIWFFCNTVFFFDCRCVFHCYCCDYYDFIVICYQVALNWSPRMICYSFKMPMTNIDRANLSLSLFSVFSRFAIWFVHQSVHMCQIDFSKIKITLHIFLHLFVSLSLAIFHALVRFFLQQTGLFAYFCLDSEIRKISISTVAASITILEIAIMECHTMCKTKYATPMYDTFAIAHSNEMKRQLWHFSYGMETHTHTKCNLDLK